MLRNFTLKKSEICSEEYKSLHQLLRKQDKRSDDEEKTVLQVDFDLQPFVSNSNVGFIYDHKSRTTCIHS